MSLINFVHPAEFDSFGEMRADHWNDPLDRVEELFQAGVHGENFQKSSIRGAGFRKRGLTEVFQRKTEGDPWVCWPTGTAKQRDIPGGALRFRLRAPASVMVFFTASIHRHNRPDVSLPRHDLGTLSTLYRPILQHADFYGQFAALWEGEDKEPGDEYLQASTMVRVRSDYDRPNMPKGVFLPWKIRPKDGLVNTPLGEVRMFDHSHPSSGLPHGGTLQAGWHNIRHTMSLLPGGSGNFPAPCLVFGNVELVVVADYGPKVSSAKHNEKHHDDDALRGRVDV